MRRTIQAALFLCVFGMAALAAPAPPVDPEIQKLQQAVQALAEQVKGLQQAVQAQQATINGLQARLDAMNQRPRAQVKITPTTGGAVLPTSAETIYKAAVADFDAHRNGGAAKGFQKLLKDYPNFDIAGNAQFYLGEIDYRLGNYQAAIHDYDSVLDVYPSCDKAASAELKKAFALLEMGETAEGTQGLRNVIAHYPNSPEAVKAKARLQELGS